MPWQPKFRALCIVEHFLKKGRSCRSVALSMHHAHALFHCVMQVSQYAQKAHQVMTACNVPEKVETQEEAASAEAATSLCVQSTDNKGPKSKAEEKSKVEAPEKCSEFDTIKDAKEEVKSLEGEREAE